MATVILQAAGAALGSVFGPVGAALGRAAGALVGNAIDQSLFATTQNVTGTHLATARIPGADEGTAINRVYGTVRIGGTMIWATRFEEDVTVERSGGKGGGGTRVETFRYYANFALALCEGEIAGVRRVWAGGREIDLTGIEMRIYRGTATQSPDPLIEAKQGTGMAPAYRGLAYVVFERLPLAAYGNRIPVLQFEVLRTVGRLESQIRAVTMIPGSTEHGYANSPVTERLATTETRIMNRHVQHARTDWKASVDELQAVCPALESVALVVSWFGTDLRAGVCRIMPGVEVASRPQESRSWSVCGKSRASAYLVSTRNGNPAYGGTPDDQSVVEAIADLKARGIKVFLYPFVMMDIADSNGLADPYGAARQAAYPWRGRITCYPATGLPGTADKTAAARTQVNAFCGTATAGQFSVSGTSVAFVGADEGYRRMILHYALLAQAAGGVDGFILGSEMVGLTHLRDAAGAFPFVEQLVALAGDVRAIVGSATQMTYGADWTEYFGYHPQDGSNEVHFNLDPLWASPQIDAVGIDNYMPLADWRDEDLTQGSPDGMRTSDDVAGMARAIAAGEGFDWYYASDAARAARTRTPITDGLAGKPWVFRNKDLQNWWSQPHFNRTSGGELATATQWMPGSKPIWFTELGCPAIDRGANQPNVFVDPKSSESAVPYFSHGQRADSMQRRFLESHYNWWTREDAVAGMVDPANIFVWTWDARPKPAFPEDVASFTDGDNWTTGHWLTGRLGAATLPEVMAAILTDHGFTDFDVEQVSGDLTGYVQADVVSARAMLEPLMTAFQIDAVDDAGTLRFLSRAKVAAPARMLSVLADLDDDVLWQETRGQESDFASQALLDHYDETAGYERTSARSRRVAYGNGEILRQSIAGVLAEGAALEAAEAVLRDHRMARRAVTFKVSPHDLSLQTGDTVSLEPEISGRFLVTRIEDSDVRKVEAREHAPEFGGRAVVAARKIAATEAASQFAPIVQLMDLPRLEAGDNEDFARCAVLSRPFRQTMLSASPVNEGYEVRARLDRPARIGSLTSPLDSGISGRFDFGAAIIMDLPWGSLESASKIAVLNGANRLAIQSQTGVWEIAAFLTATEIAPAQWKLEGLLRGLYGTEDAMLAGADTDAAAVILDQAVKPMGLTTAEAGLTLNWMVEAAGSNAMLGPLEFAGGLRAQTPLSPVHVKASRQAGGDIEIRWIRRSRIDADSWQAVDIPLDEPEERYRIEMMAGSTVVSAYETTEPRFLYAVAAETADFGGQQTELSVRLRQLGQVVANGLPTLQTIQIQ